MKNRRRKTKRQKMEGGRRKTKDGRHEITIRDGNKKGNTKEIIIEDKNST